MITTATNVAYDNMISDWMMTQRMVHPDKAKAELIQGAYESNTRFQARTRLTDYHPLTSTIMQRLVGMLYAKQEDIVRNTPMDTNDIGVNGEGINVISSEIAMNLLLYNDCIVIVETEGVKVSSPIACPRWQDDVFYTIQSTRQSEVNGPGDDQEIIDVWTVYQPNGFTIYGQEKDDRGNKRDIVIQPFTPWNAEDVDGVFRLRGQEKPPVLRPEMHWQRALGASVARGHRAIYRTESRCDAAELEAAASTKIQAGVGADEDLAEAFADALKKDRSYVPYSKDKGEHLPLSLPTGPTNALRDTIEEKERRLYKVLGITMATNAQRSATEAMIDLSTGVASTLSTLADKMQDVERDMLQLLEQARNVIRLGRPTDITIEYPSDFSNINLTE